MSPVPGACWLRAHVIADPLAEIRRDAWVEIRDGKIHRIHPGDATPPETASTKDYGQAFLLPGLIDSHCHLIFRGDGHWSDGYIEQTTPERLLLIAAENARKALRAGITTLRDLGAPGRILFELRQAIVAGDIEGPRLQLSGPPLTPPSGHAWDLGGEVASDAAARAMIRELSSRGADVIKVMASGGGTPGTSPGLPAFDHDALRRMADAAHSVGLPIVAHATCPGAVRDCALAGFDGVEHAGFWSGEPIQNRYSDEVVALLEERGVFVAPTLQASYRTMHELAGQTTAQKTRRAQLVHDAFSNFRRMTGRRIRWLAGTDAGYMINEFGDLHLGLRLMVENGMAPRDALVAATTASAEALGLTGVAGRIAEGHAADLVVLAENPLDDIRACHQVVAVYRAGERVVDASTLSWPARRILERPREHNSLDIARDDRYCLGSNSELRSA